MYFYYFSCGYIRTFYYVFNILANSLNRNK